MFRNIKTLNWLVLLLIALAVSCSETPTKKPAGGTFVTVTNYPLHYLVESIAEDNIQIVYLAPDGEDPAFWTPSQQDLQIMTEADKIFLNGATYEKWLAAASLPVSRTVDTTAGLENKFIKIAGEKHEHDGVVHSHDGTDFNTWLDGKIFLSQADVVHKTLSELVPAKKADFDRNLAALKKEITAVYEEMGPAVGKQTKFLASHPVYNYLAAANNWEMKNFHWEPNVMPSAAEWQKLKEATAFSNIMLFEDEPIKTISEKLASYGVKTIVFRPCGKKPAAKNFIQEMKNNLKALKQAFSKP